ncbi:MAG: hypothetical protein WCK15_13835 [Pirellula sp.]
MKKVRVIKLGGSLLTMPNLKQKFQRWWRENPHPLTLIIVGGGPAVDAVRQVHLANPLSDEFAHWVCIDLLQHTARIAHQILGNVDLIETMDDLQQSFSDSNVKSTTPIIAVVQVAICFAREYPNMGLPESWDVTSDSLAAAFSNMVAAEELVVMKSCDAPSDGSDLESLADLGFVDPFFPGLAEDIDQVRFVNLQKYK